MEGWHYNLHEEDWSGSEGPFPAREDAIAEALRAEEEDFYTGWCQGYSPETDDLADGVLERLAERAYEAGGEFSESWCDSISKHRNADLDEALSSAVKAWIDKHGLWPSFFTVRNVRHHSAGMERANNLEATK